MSVHFLYLARKTNRMLGFLDLNTAPIGYEPGDLSTDNKSAMVRTTTSSNVMECPRLLRNAPKQTQVNYSPNNARNTETTPTSKQPQRDGMISYARLREIIAEIKARRKEDI